MSSGTDLIPIATAYFDEFYFVIDKVNDFIA